MDSGCCTQLKNISSPERALGWVCSKPRGAGRDAVLTCFTNEDIDLGAHFWLLYIGNVMLMRYQLRAEQEHV